MVGMDKIEVCIIDYGMGNLFSVQQACAQVGLRAIVTSDINVIMESSAVILPGVGAFGEAINNLKTKGLIAAIKDFIASKRLFMGICLGMQLLMSESEEFGNYKGLGIIEGFVVKFPVKNSANQKIKVPQVGWNQIFPSPYVNGNSWDNSPLKGINEGQYLYFVHSYYCVPEDNKTILSVTNYGDITYCSSMRRKNIFAAQFHPEKSAQEGIKIYRNWALAIKEKK